MRYQCFEELTAAEGHFVIAKLEQTIKDKSLHINGFSALRLCDADNLGKEIVTVDKRIKVAGDWLVFGDPDCDFQLAESFLLQLCEDSF